MFYTQTSLGIQIDDSSLSLAYLGKGIKDIAIIASKTYPIAISFTTSDVESDEEIIGAIRDFIAEYKVKPDTVILGIPRKNVIMKIIEVPAINKEDIPNIMRYEAPRHIPYSIEEIYYDTTIIGSSRRNMLDVLFIAVQKSIIQRLLNLLGSANLRPDAIDVSSFSLLNIWAYKNTIADDEVFCFFDLSKKGFEVIFTKGKELLFTRASGSKTLFEKDGHKTDYPELTEQIVKEFEVAKKAARIEAGKSVDKIVLSGPLYAVKAVSDELFQRLKIPTEILTTASRFKSPNENEHDESLVSVGYALRGLNESVYSINLLPTENRVVRKNYGFYITLCLLAILGVLLIGLVALNVFQVVKSIKTVELEINKLEPTVKVIQKMKKEARVYQEQIDVFRELIEQKPNKLEILKELTEIIPTTTWLTSLDIKDQDVILRGRSQTPEALVQIIEDSPLFKGAKLGNVTRENFEITCKVEYEKLATEEIASAETSKNENQKQRKKGEESIDTEVSKKKTKKEDSKTSPGKLSDKSIDQKEKVPPEKEFEQKAKEREALSDLSFEAGEAPKNTKSGFAIKNVPSNVFNFLKSKLPNKWYKTEKSEVEKIPLSKKKPAIKDAHPIATEASNEVKKEHREEENGLEQSATKPEISSQKYVAESSPATSPAVSPLNNDRINDLNSSYFLKELFEKISDKKAFDSTSITRQDR